MKQAKHMLAQLLSHATSFALVVIVCLALPLLPTGPHRAQAQDAKPVMGIISGQRSGFPWIDALQTVFSQEVNVRLLNAGQSEIQWRTAFGGGQLKEGVIVSAVSSGASQLGFALAAATDFNVPMSGFGYATPFSSSNPALTARAYDQTHEMSADLQQNWRDNGLVHLTTVALDSYQIFRKQPLSSYEELTSGTYIAPPQIAAWFEGSDLKVQAVSFSEIATVIERTDIDGFLAPITLAHGLGLHAKAPHLVKANIGSLPIGHLIMFSEAWDKLTELTRAALIEGAASYRDYVASALAVSAIRAEQDILLTDGSIKRLDRDSKIKLASSFKRIDRTWTGRVGQQAGETILTTYQDNLEKLGHLTIRRWGE